MDSSSNRFADASGQVSDGSDSAAPPPPDAPTRLQIGPYQVLERIGGDEIAEVFRGFDPALDRPVAIKILGAAFDSAPEVLHQFRAEGLAAAGISHPNVVAIHFVGEESGRPYYVMQFVEGESLAARLARQERLPWQDALEIAKQGLAGLEAAHRQGVFHGGLQPSKILLEESTGRAVLIDFGRILRTSTAAKLASDVGDAVLPYVSPEQVRGQSADACSDLYALGAILYRMLASRAPFDGPTPTDVLHQIRYGEALPLGEKAPDVPADVRSVVERLMARHASERYQEAAEALADLQRLCKDDAGRKIPVTEEAGAVASPGRGSENLWQRIRDWMASRRFKTSRRLKAMLAVGVALLLLLGVERIVIAVRAMLAEQYTKSSYQSRPPTPVRSEDRYPPLTPPSSPPEKLMEGNLLYFTFEPDAISEARGYVLVHDRSGRGNHGLLLAPKRFENGQVGRALRFTSLGGFISIPTLDAEWRGEPKPLSISLWVKDDFYKRFTHLFGYEVPGLGRLNLVRSAEDRSFSFQVPWYGSSAKARDVSSVEWHHIVGVWDGACIAIYVDGRLSAKTTSEYCVKPQSPIGAHLVPQVGSLPSREPQGGFEGCIDELAIFGRGLFAAEVQSLYEMGLKGQRPELAPPDPSPTRVFARIDEILGDTETVFVPPALADSSQTANPDQLKQRRAFAITQDQSEMLVGSLGGTIIQWDVKPRKKLAEQQLLPTGARLRGLTLSPDERQVACFGQTASVYLWDFRQRNVAREIATGLAEVCAVAFSPDGRRIAVGGRPTTAKDSSSSLGIFEVEAGKRLRDFSGLSQVLSVAWSGDGVSVLASTPDDKKLHLLRADGSEIGSLAAPEAVQYVQFVPDNARAVATCRDGTLRVIDVPQMREVHVLQVHTGETGCLAVSRDGRFAIVGGEDGICAACDLARALVLRSQVTRDEAIRFARFGREPRSAILGTSAGHIIPVEVQENRFSDAALPK